LGHKKYCKAVFTIYSIDLMPDKDETLQINVRQSNKEKKLTEGNLGPLNGIKAPKPVE